MAQAAERLTIDGSYGEGGGQILRTTLSLSAITGRAVRVENIRAARANPGLAAQHLTAVRAVASLCDAGVEGAGLGARELEFVPRRPVRAGAYEIDVAAARPGGSAGAVMLVLQALLLPLALADGESRITLHGGTHVQASPSFDYARDVWLATLQDMGVDARLELRRSGWYPVGRGEVRARIRGRGGALAPLVVPARGALLRVSGRALSANLPAHIGQRMAERAQALLHAAHIAAEIDAVQEQAACVGTGIFLTAHYEHCRAGFGALGVRGKPAEQVAEEAVAALLKHRASGAALEEHLSDQIALAAALAAGESTFSVDRVSRHLTTNAWVVERFGLARVQIAQAPGAEQGLVTISPRGAA